MKDTIDKIENIDSSIHKLSIIAFNSILFALFIIAYKFVIYFLHSTQIDSALIPNYVHTFPFKISFASGLILCLSLIVTLYLYKLKKYTLVIILNAIFIVRSISLPYIMQVVNN